MFHSDNYYVIIYREDRGVFTRRIDRLSDISVCDEPISAEAEAKIAETEKFSTDVFGMYTGPREKVILEFTDETFEYIFDKFGEKQKIIKTEVVDGVQIYSTEVDVEISPPFWGWVCTFAGKLRIAGPDWVNTEFNKWKTNENKLDLEKRLIEFVVFNNLFFIIYLIKEKSNGTRMFCSKKIFGRIRPVF